MNPFGPLAEQMVTLSAPMPPDDGVRGFNDLYLAVTRAVGTEFDEHPFEDPVFFSRLAPTFADMYFAAVAAVTAGGQPSRVWEPLFAKRFEPNIAPLQFAIAGMNAHINHDLSLALVATTNELGVGLELDTPHHRDHMRVNAILARVMQEVKGDLETGIVPEIDKSLGTLDDLVANWSIEAARNNAWTQAQMLVALEDQHVLHEQYLSSIARTVAFTSRALLVRTG
ncbi:MAG: hypothetical protein QOJ46_575 [bacterium]